MAAQISRATFLKGVTLGGTLLGGLWGSLPWLPDVFRRRGSYVFPDRLETSPDVEVRYSVCRMCHSDCGLESRVFNNRLIKLDGNPYHPNTTEPHLIYETAPADALTVTVPHTLCARGQAGLQILYDPYRILRPLKRTGPRGSGRFKTITWEQLIDETVNGGQLFKDVPGEEQRSVEGFKALWDNGQGRFAPADPAHPDMGPRTNQLVIYWGRAEPGQNNFITRFAAAFGTINALPHVGICELNHHVATQQSLNGAVAMLKPDIVNAEFIVWFGAGIYTANFPMQTLARKVAESAATGRLKFVLVDVAATTAVAHADRFITVRPGGDGALAMGMIRWMLEHGRYDAQFLAQTTFKAAGEAGYPNYTNAAYLVIVDPRHPHALKFARTADLHLAEATSPDAGKFVVLNAQGKPRIYDQVAEGLLWPHGALNTDPVVVAGIPLQTALQLLYVAAKEHSLAEYAQLAGIAEHVIPELAEEFSRHGHKAVADFYRGPAMHTNGFYAGRAIMTLNFLAGNVDWAGGSMAGGGTADWMGATPGSPYNLTKWPNQPAKIPTGVKISREGTAYEDTSYYKGAVAAGQSPFPAKRPWFPLGFGIWHEIFAGIWHQYPYPAKIVFQHMANPAYSAPPGMSGHHDENLPWFRMIKDLEKVPLFITDDIVLSETAAYADYIVPDTTYLEAWGMLPGYPTTPTAVIGVRQPVVEPLTGRTPDGRVMCFETYFIDVAGRLGLPGFGKNAFLEGGALQRREDYYLKMVANIAYDHDHFLTLSSDGHATKQGPVPDGGTAELQAIARWHTPFQPALSDAQWRKVAYVMARGGRFENYAVAYQRPRFWGAGAGWLTHRYGSATNWLQIYNERVATLHNALTGERFLGTAHYVPEQTMKGRLLTALQPAAEYPFYLSTYKLPIHSKAKTMASPWLRELLPEAFVEMNDFDASRLGIRDGDYVRVTSLHYARGIVGRARIMPGVRPGVVTFTNSFGHWQYGSGTWLVDGKAQRGDEARNAPVRLNAVMLLDPDMLDATGWGTCLEDPVGGGAAYFDTCVKVSKL